MIALLRNALDLLDEQGRAEVLQFIYSQQNPDGGFKDRGGRSDLYYSLFGGMILKTINSSLNPPKGDFDNHSKIKFRKFIKEQNVNLSSGFIEKCCLVLLQKELKIGRTSRIRNLFLLGRLFWKERYSINLSYQSFVLFLTLDAVFPFKRILKLTIKKMLLHAIVDQNSPCAEVAARVFLLKMLEKDGLEEQDLLKSFACDSGGFKAFQHLQQGDMLSTAVALFALRYAGCDLRLLKPACLDFIEQHFSDGAFLSGDGDPTADVEYTFYGLLALGVLAD